jgi:uncharacterized protein GlcG (DUF336 family)
MKTRLFISAVLLAFPALAHAQAEANPQGNMLSLSGPPLALALEAAQAAVAACKAKGVPVGVTVEDATGGLRVVLGSDGAVAADANGSRRTANLSTAFKASGPDIMARMKSDKTLADKINANEDWLSREGALQIKKGDTVVGVIAVEGHPHDAKRDIGCAQAGIDAIQSRLP